MLEDYCKQEEDSEFLDDEKINASELNEENIPGILTVKTCRKSRKARKQSKHYQ